jgi:hypothetical protein
MGAAVVATGNHYLLDCLAALALLAGCAALEGARFPPAGGRPPLIAPGRVAPAYGGALWAIQREQDAPA